MKGARKLTAAEVDRRRAIAAREDLTRREQAALVGMGLQSWLQTLSEERGRYRARKRSAAKRAQIRAAARLRGNEGAYYTVTGRPGQERITLTAACVRILGLRKGERARVVLRAGHLEIEAAA